MTSFFEGNEADSLARRPLEVRRRAFVESTVRVFGVETFKPVEHLGWGWSTEQYTEDCYEARFASGVWTFNGPVLAILDGYLYWAGVEYSTRFSGYIGGAVRPGEGIAATVAVALV